MIALIASLFALASVLAGCADGRESTASPSATATASGVVVVATIAPVAVASLATKPQAAPLVGRWRGSFESKKAAVELAPGVKERAWSKDEGRLNAGKGEIEFSVNADGVVKGSLRGALGEATLAGTADGDSLTMTFTPKGDASDAISGVIVLRLQGAKLAGELKGASGDAGMVRAASLELSRGDS